LPAPLILLKSRANNQCSTLVIGSAFKKIKGKSKALLLPLLLLNLFGIVFATHPQYGNISSCLWFADIIGI